MAELAFGTFTDAEDDEARRLLTWGFREDLGDPPRDVTSEAVVPADLMASATVVARRTGVVAGLPILPLIAEFASSGFTAAPLAQDGAIAEGQPVARLAGRLRDILMIERLLLNVLCHLSGVATLTAEYVRRARGTKAKLCDTRKTTPGWRRLEKYAVRVGGGVNHRLALFDGVLIKDNHLAGIASEGDDPVRVAVERARAAAPAGSVIEIEVDSLVQLESALVAKPDIVLLDNMDPEMLSIAVEMRDLRGPGVLLEASGGVNLNSVAAIAKSGVDRISVGALTHSAPALDLALDYETRLS